LIPINHCFIVYHFCEGKRIESKLTAVGKERKHQKEKGKRRNRNTRVDILKVLSYHTRSYSISRICFHGTDEFLRKEAEADTIQ
jgi:hypothetical protein